MTSIVDTAAAAFVSSLQQAPAVTAVVERTRLRPLSAEMTEMVVVRPHGAEPSEEAVLTNGLPVSWTAVFDIECYKRAPAGTAPDAAVDALICAVYARLMADPTLGGAVRWIQPAGLGYEYDAKAEQDVCATFKFLALLTAAPLVFTP
jgi:hypothetical protein